MRDVTKAWTSVAADSRSTDLRTRRSWCRWKKPAEQTVETCMSSDRSDDHGHT